MTAAQRSMRRHRPVLAQTVALAVAYRWLRRRRGHPVVRRRGGQVRSLTQTSVLALGPPAVLVGARAARTGARWCPPITSEARAGLALQVLLGALGEELLWRGAATLALPTWARRSLAGLGGVGFAAAHLPRDGRAALPVHALISAGWTVAAYRSRSLAGPVVGHTAYNLALYCLRTPEPR